MSRVRPNDFRQPEPRFIRVIDTLENIRQLLITLRIEGQSFSMLKPLFWNFKSCMRQRLDVPRLIRGLSRWHIKANAAWKRRELARQHSVREASNAVSYM